VIGLTRSVERGISICSAAAQPNVPWRLLRLPSGKLMESGFVWGCGLGWLLFFPVQPVCQMNDEGLKRGSTSGHVPSTTCRWSFGLGFVHTLKGMGVTFVPLLGLYTTGQCTNKIRGILEVYRSVLFSLVNTYMTVC
jgi:hypothetical protein